MKASELIVHLKKAIKQEGDLDIRLPIIEQSDSVIGDSQSLEGFVTLLNEEDKPSYFLLCDDNNLDSFD